MPPKRKSPAATPAAPAMPSRITRSMAAGKQPADAPSKKEEAVAVQVPPLAPAGQKGRKKAKKEEEEAAAAVVEEVEAVLSPPPAAKGKGKKNAKKEVVVSAAPAPAKEEEEGEEDSPVVEDGKSVVVEACTQCQQFKMRATKVKKDLESALPGVSVIINPEKPRRGCLEIREEGGEVFISLLDMPRPFKAMRELDMDKVIQDIVKKIS